MVLRIRNVRSFGFYSATSTTSSAAKKNFPACTTTSNPLNHRAGRRRNDPTIHLLPLLHLLHHPHPQRRSRPLRPRHRLRVPSPSRLRPASPGRKRHFVFLRKGGRGRGWG